MAFPADWIEVRRGFGSIDLYEDLKRNAIVTASGLQDGGYIVWKRANADSTGEREAQAVSADQGSK
jgi:hypothetical protein